MEDHGNTHNQKVPQLVVALNSKTIRDTDHKSNWVKNSDSFYELNCLPFKAIEQI